MTIDLTVTLTILAALGSALVAGIFFAFSTFVMTALGRLPPSQGIAAMQSINIVVLNPWFFAAFFGTGVICLTLVVLVLFRWDESGAVYRLAGGVLYLLSCIFVTMAFNVPLNNKLAGARPESAEGATLWARYLSVWTGWNHVRTVGPLLAAVLLILALR